MFSPEKVRRLVRRRRSGASVLLVALDKTESFILALGFPSALAGDRRC